MRDVTKQATIAFMNHANVDLGTTRIADGTMYLYDNMIAQWRSGQLWITTAGHNTTTTRQRLNGILQAVHPRHYINTKSRQLTLSGVYWDGKWILVD